jgi:quercetin dioxygenase-like cupin family protein
VIVIRGRADATTRLRGETFTGDVWSDSVLPATDGVVINTIVFTPGARTHWHHHEHGQILQVTAGAGYVCAAGGQPQLVRAGDTVWTPPGERHWHGATPTTTMSHTAVSLGTTEWAEAVADDDYAPTKDDE